MITRLPVLLVACGVGVGAIVALPAFALAVAPWVGVALVLFVLVAGGLGVLLIRAEYTYRAFHAQLQADTERFRLRLEAGRGTGRDVTVYDYYQER